MDEYLGVDDNALPQPRPSGEQFRLRLVRERHLPSCRFTMPTHADFPMLAP
jgi:hypothetical protein